MKLALRTFLVILIAFFLIGLAATWPPDLLLKRDVLLAALPLSRGEKIRIVQVVGNDFYRIELRHYLDATSYIVVVLDGDAAKSWRCKLKPKENGDVAVRFWRYHGSYDPKRHVYKYRDGTAFEAGRPDAVE
jgi:hypothetical protein